LSHIADSPSVFQSLATLLGEWVSFHINNLLTKKPVTPTLPLSTLALIYKFTHLLPKLKNFSKIVGEWESGIAAFKTIRKSGSVVKMQRYSIDSKEVFAVLLLLLLLLLFLLLFFILLLLLF